METLTFSHTEIARIKDHVSTEICSWKLMIRQFSDLRDKNSQELTALEKLSHKDDKTLRKIEVLKALNRSLDDSIDECLDLILKNNRKIETFKSLQVN
jgi:hypothetical protein